MVPAGGCNMGAERMQTLSPEDVPTWWTNNPAWWPETAQEHARAGRLEEWVHAFLADDGWNEKLLNGLRSRPHWWRGPVEADLGELIRICGPEAEMSYRPHPVLWEIKIRMLQDGLRDPLRVPPLIVEYRYGKRIISDGAHRHEAMRRRGWAKCWIVIWYQAEEAFKRDGGRQGFPSS